MHHSVRVIRLQRVQQLATVSAALNMTHKIGKAYMYSYSTFNETSPQGAQVWITQGFPCKLHHTCLYLANIRQMAPPEWQTSHSSSLLIYRPRKDERLSWPSWLTYSGRYTHISGHTSAADRAEARESSPVRDRRSNH